jgi:predicted aspartyl protease
MTLFRFWIALLLAVGLFSTVPPLAFCEEKRRAEIVLPFQNVQGEMVVTMSLQGHKGMNFVVDTGFGVTMLDASAATAAHLKLLPLKAPPLQSLAGAIPLTQAAPHAQITGYGLKLHGNLIVGDLQELQKGMGIPLAGIIGFDFLGQLPFLVDYSARTITILPTKPQQGIEVTVEPPIPDKFEGLIVCLNLELPDGRRVKANLIVDTGSTEGLILHVPFVKKYGLQPVEKVPTVSRVAYGGAYNVTSGLVPALLLGDLRVEDLQTLYDVNPVGMAGSERIDGEIGYKILSRFRIFVDAPHHVVVFEPVAR